jgi:hypothetical protein
MMCQDEHLLPRSAAARTVLLVGAWVARVSSTRCYANAPHCSQQPPLNTEPSRMYLGLLAVG